MTAQPWSLVPSLVAFALAAVAIGLGGVKLTARAEHIARATGLGELLTGAVLIGAVTSLAGLITTITAAASGHASLAVSNSLGGIAAQTTFLAMADLAYRRANLEHAAASEANLLQGNLLITLLALPLLAMAKPNVAVLDIHPVSIFLVAAYLFGMRLIDKAQEEPMWRPRVTGETLEGEDKQLADSAPGPVAMWVGFLALAGLVAGSGWILARAAISISIHAGVAETVIGGVLTAITTSLPELVVAIAAVRRGALVLAVGDILGGNTFDVLFLSAADLAYQDGSIYTAISDNEIFWVALTIVLVGVLLLGLLRREKHGVANIGFESVLVLAIYLVGVLTLVFA
ncbi:MAG: hypothetical protein R3200_03840 [Xanthomonadales bacterium]|nr:hypothetical protein [Xanthomonadales bacterium]